MYAIRSYYAPRIDIRGLRTRQILTLIDGVPFYTSQDDTFVV